MQDNLINGSDIVTATNAELSKVLGAALDRGIDISNVPTHFVLMKFLFSDILQDLRFHQLKKRMGVINEPQWIVEYGQALRDRLDKFRLTPIEIEMEWAESPTCPLHIFVLQDQMRMSVMDFVTEVRGRNKASSTQGDDPVGLDALIEKLINKSLEPVGLTTAFLIDESRDMNYYIDRVKLNNLSKPVLPDHPYAQRFKVARAQLTLAIQRIGDFNLKGDHAILGAPPAQPRKGIVDDPTAL